MSYVPQLCLTNAQVEKEELLALQRIFHLPHHAFPKDSFYYLSEGGFRKTIPISVTAKAALIRTAYRTCTVWREEPKMLETVRFDLGLAPLRHLTHHPDATFHPDNKWWKSQAFVDNLSAATRYAKEQNIQILADSGKGNCSRAFQADISKQIVRATLNSSLANSIAFRLHRFVPVESITDDELVTQINASINFF